MHEHAPLSLGQQSDLLRHFEAHVGIGETVADLVRERSQIPFEVPLHVEYAEDGCMVIVGATNKTFEAHH